MLEDANGGIDDIVEAQRPFALAHGVSFGDLCVPFRISKLWNQLS